MKEMINRRKAQLKNLFDLNEPVTTKDERMIHLLKLLENKEAFAQEENETLKQDYQQLLRLRKKIVKNEALEKAFEVEMNMSVNHFINQYLMRTDDKYERWGLTNIPRTEEMKQKYPLEEEPEVRNTYRFQKDDEEMIEIHNPKVIAFIDFLEHKITSHSFLKDYRNYIQLNEKYHLNMDKKPEMLDLLSGSLGFKNQKELNTWFLQELGTTPNRFINQYANKNFINEVGIWGLISSPNQNQIEGIETYCFTPSGNRIVDSKNQAPLVNYVEEKRQARALWISQMKEQEEKQKENSNIETSLENFAIPTVESLGLTFPIPKEILKYYPTISTLRSMMNEYLELQTYGLSFEEMNIYLYQKFLLNDAALLKTNNYLELAQQEKVALDYLASCQQQKQVEKLEQQSVTFIQSVLAKQRDAEKTKQLEYKSEKASQKPKLALA